MNKKYDQPPVSLGEFRPEVSEMMLYQYLPVKMAGIGETIKMYPCLHPFKELLAEAMIDFLESTNKKLCDHYIYITAKRMFVAPGQNVNRLGWHSDGFMTQDVSYVWCDSIPTLWTDSFPDPPVDDTAALAYFNSTLHTDRIYQTEAFHLYRMDQFVVHACDVATETTLRTFVKINFSKDRYDLKGNSHNYMINYNWPMKERKTERNHPQSNLL